MIAPWRQIIYLTIIESINSLNQSLSVSMLLYPGKKLLKTILFFCYCSSIVNYKIMRYWEILENVCEEQGFYNCLRQGFGITPKIWSFCTLEFTVHSALFEPVCFVIVLTKLSLPLFHLFTAQYFLPIICLQIVRNKAECTVNSRVQKDQILGAIYPVSLSLEFLVQA